MLLKKNLFLIQVLHQISNNIILPLGEGKEEGNLWFAFAKNVFLAM